MLEESALLTAANVSNFEFVPNGDPTLADAILDRIVHNAHRLKLRGDSLRKKTAVAVAADA